MVRQLRQEEKGRRGNYQQQRPPPSVGWGVGRRMVLMYEGRTPPPCTSMAAVPKV